MPRNLWLTPCAAIVVVALGVTGCTHDTAKKLDSTETSLPVISSSAPAAAPTAPLPPPEALTAVLSRLADPASPGAEKLDLVEGSTPETATALDRFTTAARDNGYLPMSFTASNLGWSGKDPTDVSATVVVITARPDHRDFTFPMVFNSFQGGWQLSRATAEMLLAMQSAGTLPPRSPAPPPVPIPPPPSAPPPSAPAPPPIPSVTVTPTP